MSSTHRVYDYRIREHIVRTGNPDLFPELEIPRGTTLTWIRRGMPDVVWLDDPDGDNTKLRERVARLERRVAMLTALLRLTLTVMRISGFHLNAKRISSDAHRQALLSALEHARRVMPVRAALRVLHISSSSIAEWKRTLTPCERDDTSSCPMPHPQRLSAKERMSIKDIVLSSALRHLSIRALALHAQRAGEVFAHPSTWGKLIRVHGWRRPRVRMHPAKPKEGVPATRPNEKWHVDVSVLRLLDGTKVYLHAAIDNFSRKILAWKVADCLQPMGTCEVLQEAARHLHREEAVQIVCDGGVENFNTAVDAVIEQFEWFLYRLSKTPHRTYFVLKGALMLRAWDAPLARATTDLDFLGRLENSLENLERVDKARVAMQIDVGFGDVITPGAEPITYPVLLDFPAPALSGYPR